VFILFWAIGTSHIKLGITTDNNLLTLRRTGGTGMLVAIPFFEAGGNLSENVFERIVE
jgi:hypothetical protein